MQINCVKNPLICAIIPFVFGIISGQYILSFNITLYISILCLSLYLIFKTRKIATFFLLMTLFFAGMLRYQQSVEVLPANHLNELKTGQIKSVIGTISNSRYSANGRHQYTVSCDSVLINNKWMLARGEILLRTKKIKQKYSYGMRMRIQGQLRLPPNERNPGQFDYRQYLAQNDIAWIMQISSSESAVILQMNRGNWLKSNLILPIKRYCQRVFYVHLEHSSAAVMNALILGEKQDIDRNTIENFQQVGVVHVLAISGLHVGYVIIFVFTFLSFLRLSQNYRTLILGLVLLVYIILVDFKPPVMRASLMALFYLWGQLMERKISTGNLLAAAAFIILLFEPRELTNPGFQFSFAAVISIIYGYHKMNDILPGKMWFKNYKIIKNIVWNPLLVSLSAVIGTLPLTLFYYGTIPLIAVGANLIVIPIIGLIVFLGFFLLLLHPISISLGDGIGTIIHLIFNILKGMTDILSDLPFASLDLPIPDLLLTIIISSGICILFFLKQGQMIKVLPVYTTVLGLYILINSIPDSPAIDVTFIDVGQGDAAFIQFPNKSTMLIDAGDANQYWDNGKAAVIPYLKQHGTTKINYLVGSHPHDDHIGGFHSIIDKLSVDTVVFSAYPYESKNYQRFLEKCHARKIPIRIVARGNQLYPDSTCRVYILHPDSGHIGYQNGSGGECNNSSLVMKIQYGQNGILFTGDLEVEAEPALLLYKNFLECELVKIAHHGSKTSTSQSFLNFIQPLVAVIPVAEKNKFKHPSPGTVERLKRQQIQAYFTSRDGAVVFKIGAQKIRKISWR